MTSFRGAIPDFQLANPIYIGATVSFFTVDQNGDATTTAATLYAAPTGLQTVSNPQILDGYGKFSAPVYIDAPVRASVSALNVPTHATGVINPRGRWRGSWATVTVYYSTDFVYDPVSGNTYAVVADYLSGASIGADITAGALVLVINPNNVVFPVSGITCCIDGGGAVILTGQRGPVVVPFNCTITEMMLLGDQTGSMVIDIWKTDYAGYPPSAANSICAAALPTLTGARKTRDTTLTGWTTSLSADDLLIFNVSLASSLLRATLSLRVTRT